MSRRTFTAGGIGTILGGGASLPAARVVAAQGSTDLTGLGLPTLDINVTANAFEGMPDELAAGRYLLTVTLASGVDEGGAAFVQPPAGMSAQEFLDALGGLGGGATPEASPPEVEPEASPSVEEESEEVEILPSFVYQTRFAGGSYATPDTPGTAVIDLGPGEWILWGDDPAAAQPPVIFTATGDMPADLPEPDADVTVTMIDFAIEVEGSLTAGEHVVRVENQGAQPHFLVVSRGPDTMTNEDIAVLINVFFGGASPEALPFDPDRDLQDVVNTPTQSIGTVLWTPVTLEAGAYAAFCFFPTAGEGLPHVVHGMHTVFTVS